MTYETETRGEYRGLDPIVQLTAAQINRILEAGSKNDWQGYMAGIERLIDLLPPDVEETVLEHIKKNNIIYDLTEQGKQSYVALFRFIKHLLSKENIVWKRSRFEIGKE